MAGPLTPGSASQRRVPGNAGTGRGVSPGFHSCGARFGIESFLAMVEEGALRAPKRRAEDWKRQRLPVGRLLSATKAGWGLTPRRARWGSAASVDRRGGRRVRHGWKQRRSDRRGRSPACSPIIRSPTAGQVGDAGSQDADAWQGDSGPADGDPFTGPRRASGGPHASARPVGSGSSTGRTAAVRAGCASQCGHLIRLQGSSSPGSEGQPWGAGPYESGGPKPRLPPYRSVSPTHSQQPEECSISSALFPV